MASVSSGTDNAPSGLNTLGCAFRIKEDTAPDAIRQEGFFFLFIMYLYLHSEGRVKCQENDAYPYRQQRRAAN